MVKGKDQSDENQEGQMEKQRLRDEGVILKH